LKGSMELASAKEAYEAIPLMSDFSWVKDPGKREAKMNAYAEARRQLDRFVSECVQPRVTQKHYKTAAKRIGLDWNHKESLTQTEAFAVADFTVMYDDSEGFTAVDLAALKTERGKDPDYDAAMDMLKILRYTWYEVLGMKAHCGLKCRDLLTDREFFLFDRQLSTYPQMKGAAMAAGIMPVGDCFMTTGFALPLFSSQSATFFASMLKSVGIDRPKPIFLTKKETAMFAATTIGALLDAGAGDMIRMR